MSDQSGQQALPELLALLAVARKVPMIQQDIPLDTELNDAIEACDTALDGHKSELRTHSNFYWNIDFGQPKG